MRDYWENDDIDNPDYDRGEPMPQPEKMPRYMMWFLAIAFVFVVLSCGLSGYSDGKTKVQSLKWADKEEYLK